MNTKGFSITQIAITALTVVFFPLATWLITTKMVCSEISHSAKSAYVAEKLKSGQLAFPASFFISDNEVKEIASGDTAYINNITRKRVVANDSIANDGIEIKPITGHTFFAKLMIIHDPSRVKLGTTYPWGALGIELHELVDSSKAIGGINGGWYFQGRNTGGHPLGVAVCDGQIQYNSPGTHGLTLVGLDKQNKLHIIDLTRKRAADVEKIVKEKGIRDAVTFPDEARDESNWFVRCIDGDYERKVDARRCCINPRTVIGQRADGAVMLLVTDGRGADAHIGATAADIVRVMKENGAVAAANLDGGSSSCMYYKGKYEMTSATFYYAKGSWRLPTAFIVK